MGGNQHCIALCSARNRVKEGRPDSLPALPAAAGAVIGAVAVDFPWVWVVAALFFAILIFVRVRLVPALLFIVVTVAVFMLACRMELSEADSDVFDGRERLWTGTVESVRSSDRSQRCVVVFDSPVAMRCRMTLADITPALRPGDIIEVEGVTENSRKYVRVPLLAYTGDRSERTVADMLVMQRSCRVTGHSDTFWFRLQNLRYSLAEYVYDSPLGASTARLLAASVFGGGDVGDERKAAFRASGLSHLLCVSGFHVAVFAMVIAFILFPLKIGERAGRWRYLFIILAVGGYAAVTGLQPSVFRAAVMLTGYNIARVFQRNSPPLNSLCLAVVIILTVNPLWVFSSGFQLSVAAVLGLLILSRRLNPVGRGHRLYGVFALLTVPLAAAVATAPVLLWHFHSLPLLTVPANALASLVFPLFMIAGCFVVLLSAVGIPVGFAAVTVDRLAEIIDGICAMAVDSGWANPDGISLGVYNMAVLCACIVIFTAFLYSRKRAIRLVLASTAVLLAVTAMLVPDRAAASDLAVHGNAYASEMRLRSEGHGYIVPLSSRKRPIGNPENYFLDGGVAACMIVMDPDSICHERMRLHGDMLMLGDRRVLIASNDSSGICGTVDFHVLRGRYRGCLDSLLVRNSPSTVIIASDMDPDRREAYAETAAAAGAAVCDLTREVFLLDF